MPSCLLIVDVQKGFLNEGTRHVPSAVAELQHRFERVVVARMSNPEGSALRTVAGWEKLTPGSPETEFAFTPRRDAWIVDKTAYSAATPELLRRLDAEAIRRVHIAGIATDNCVLKTAVDLLEAGLVPVVLAGYCASHGGPELHDCALRILRRFIGDRQVI